MGNAITVGKEVAGILIVGIKKVKNKDNDVDNLFMGATLCGEFQ